MRFSIRGQNAVATASGSIGTVTLPVTTNAGDTIIAVGSMNSTNAITGSGGGATWTNFNVGAGPSVSVCVGYNCSAGQTTCSLSTGGLGDYGVFVCSGLTTSNPVLHSLSATGSTSGATVTTGSMTHEGASSVLLAGVCCFSTSTPWTSVPGSWSVGATDTQIYADTTSSQRVFWASYALPLSGTTTTYTTPNPGASQAATGVYILDLAIATPPSPPAGAPYEQQLREGRIAVMTSVR